VAVLAFALGIGANSAIFSVVNSVLIKPLNYSEPDRLVVAEHVEGPVAPATFLDWKQDSNSFEQMAAAQAWGGSLRTSGPPEPVIGLRVSANMFTLLGVAPAIGRTFSREEDRDGSEPVVVLSHALWQRSFGGAKDIVGRRIEIDSVGYTVIGVMPESFQFAPFWITNAEIWTPFSLGERKTDRMGRSVRVFAKLKRGVTADQARAELSTIMARLAQEYPDSSAKLGVSLLPLRERVVGGIRLMLVVLLGTVGFVLLIACANVANLMLARAAGRRREIAVRLALGASRWQLARQAITESTLLAALGGAIAIAMAYAGVYALESILPPGAMPRQSELKIDPESLIFTTLLSIVTGIATGFLPAWHFSKGDIHDALSQGSRSGTENPRSHRTRSLLVISEIALAFVLLIGAGLMLRSFARLLSLNPGFDPSNLLSLQLSVSGTRQADPARRGLYYQEVLGRVRSVPGVQLASAINHPPITGDVWGTRFRLEGRPEPVAGEWPSAVYRMAYPGYFAAMRTPILRGRDFTANDDLKSPRVAIVNESLARRFWPREDPVGKRIGNAPGTEWFNVIAVVHDVKQADWQGDPREEIYFPLLQSEHYLFRDARHYEFLNLVVRVDADAAGKAASVRNAVESIDPNVLVSNVISMERAVAQNLWRPRLSLLLLGSFGVLALVLSITGTYGVISHAVSQRTHEIGIRMALGAARRDVLVMALRQSLVPVLIGIASGGAAALAMTQVMSSMLYQVTPTDPATFAGVAALMFAAGLFAALWPALRASRVDPMTALRHG
jgi:putative ABC transport system permease protein